MPNNATYNIITASEKSPIKFWSSSSGKLNFSLNNSLPQNISADKLLVIEGKYLCSTHKNGMIRLWSLKNKSLIAVIDNGTKDYSSGVEYFEYLGKGLLASSRFKSEKQYSIAIWDLYKNNQLKYEIKDKNNAYFSDPYFNLIADGYLFIYEGGLIWDVEKKVYKDVFPAQNQVFVDFIRINQTHFAGMMEDFSDYTDYTDYSFSFSKTLSIFNSFDFTSYVLLFLKDDERNTYFYAIDNNYLAVLFGDDDYRIRIVNISNGESKCEFDSLSHRNTITYIENIGNGLFASGAKDALIKIWDINSCSLVQTFDNFENDLDSDQITKLVPIDGLFLASLSKYSVKLWDLNSLTLKYRFNNSEAGFDLVNNDLEYYKLF